MNSGAFRAIPRLSLPLDASGIANLSALFDTVGSSEFLRNLWESFRIGLDFDAGGVMTFFTDQPPQKGFMVFSREKRGTVNEEGYFLGPYALDPVYRHFVNGCPTDLYRLADIAPDDFHNSEYFSSFYARNRIVDSLEFIWRIDHRSAILIFFEREAGSPLYSALEIQSARQWLPVATSALKKHHSLARPDTKDMVNQVLHRKVQITLEHFGSSVLTHREHQVLGYMLNGYSVTRTAEKLAIAEGTVKIHRNSIHGKLEIGSQAELFSLFVRCIPYARPDEPSDPLIFYQGNLSRD